MGNVACTISNHTFLKPGGLPIHCACNMTKNIDQLEIVSMLAQHHNLKVLKTKHRSWQNSYFLKWALDKRSIPLVKQIFEADPTSAELQLGAIGWALHYACGHAPSMGMVQLLCQVNKNALSLQNKKGKLPLRLLHEAAAPKNIIKIVFDAFPAAYDGMFEGGGEVLNPL